jgi:hypothetical protein
MRTVGRLLLVVGLAVVVASYVTAAIASAATPAAGITISPAAITLNLQKGAATASSTFSVANHYSASVVVRFAIEPSRQQALGSDDARKHIAVQHARLTIAGNSTASQTVTFTDGKDVTPGSLTADLVVSQETNAVQGVGILPSLRLPVTAVKYDGAVASLGAAAIAGPRVAMSIPKDVTLTLTNTGNMIAIPRGVVTIQASNGTTVGKAVLNEASVAVMPGASTQLRAPVTTLSTATMPGPYTIRADYGLGGDSPSQSVQAAFIFVAWWHVAVLIAVVAAVWYGIRQRQYLVRILSRLRRPTSTAAPTPSAPARRVHILVKDAS